MGEIEKGDSLYTLKSWLYKNSAKIILSFMGIAIGLSTSFLTYNESANSRDDDYIAKYVNCIYEVSRVNEELAAVKASLLTLEIANGDIPFPYWIKDKDGIITSVSDVYERDILIPLGFRKHDVVGTKGEVFGEEFVNEILLNDKKVIMSGKTLRFKESVPGQGMGTSYKFALKSEYYGVLGTAGIWIPDERD